MPWEDHVHCIVSLCSPAALTDPDLPGSLLMLEDLLTLSCALRQENPLPQNSRVGYCVLWFFVCFILFQN